jgi:hypothetical protein
MAKTVLWGLSIVYFGRIVTLVFLSGVSPGFAASQTYSYKDESGTPNFTTELDSTTEKYRNRVVPLDSITSSLLGAGVPISPPVSSRVVTASGECRMGDHDT